MSHVVTQLVPNLVVTNPENNELNAITSPLRRASYVHVSDLVKTYNIDINRLKAEITKIKSLEEAHRNEGNKHDAMPASNLTSEKEKSDNPTSSQKPSFHQRSFHQPKLMPPSGGYNLCLLVGKVDVVVDKLRVDKSRVRLAEVEVGDETGCVSLRARDDQIDMLQDISEKKMPIVLRNCTLELYQGKHLRLAVTKWGKLCPYPDRVASTPKPPSSMNKALNYSTVDMNIVADVRPEVQNYGNSLNGKQVSHYETDPSRPPTSNGRQKHSSNQYPYHHQYRKGNQKLHRLEYINYAPHGNMNGYQNQDHGMTVIPNSNMIGNANSFSSVYCNPSQLFSYLPHPMVTGNQVQSPTEQQVQNEIHQKQQIFLLQQYELQQRQLEQIYQQEQHQRAFDRLNIQGQQNASDVRDINMDNVSVNTFPPYLAMGSNFMMNHNLQAAATQNHGDATTNQNIDELQNNDADGNISNPFPSQQMTHVQPNVPQVKGPDLPLYSNREQPIGHIAVENQRLRSESWSQESVNANTIEVPISPRMNPQAPSFAPTYSSDGIILQSPQVQYQARSISYTGYAPAYHQQQPNLVQEQLYDKDMLEVSHSMGQLSVESLPLRQTDLNIISHESPSSSSSLPS
mmetsp:Transcript_3356/g.4706  ORF Transcript_3356/g.4706 Transcript_3356/m.4706 type:complete len:627 (+) Transcript_3356:399-2279(+)|eukprot:CAMPEP_0184870382 /NCGR_PEP_ID=MMETSP0580-20130426/37254_1 /TAXON_ID=1118495 /ORGANISM="Dactyliosolen fragilissimus" /LENGTH=626 /DNA_ID=CAMNT_0027372421 /DNA_START=261 /DNA_END=2141 /DNA_ORIENTATION=+